MLSSSRGQGNFRGLEASRPRTSKCVLEDVLEAKDVLEDSTSVNRSINHVLKSIFGTFSHWLIFHRRFIHRSFTGIFSDSSSCSASVQDWQLPLSAVAEHLLDLQKHYIRLNDVNKERPLYPNFLHMQNLF